MPTEVLKNKARLLAIYELLLAIHYTPRSPALLGYFFFFARNANVSSDHPLQAASWGPAGPRAGAQGCAPTGASPQAPARSHPPVTPGQEAGAAGRKENCGGKRAKP